MARLAAYQDGIPVVRTEEERTAIESHAIPGKTRIHYTVTGAIQLWSPGWVDAFTNADSASSSAVTEHVAEADPHTQYQKESEKGAVSGYASLDASTKVPIAQLPTGATGTTVPLGNHTHAAADVASGTLDIARIPTGTTGTTVALGNHAHTGVYEPAITTLAVAKGGTALSSLGTAQHFLRVNSAGNALEYSQGQPALFDAGNSGTSKAIDWANGPVQKVTMTGNCTFTFSNATSGGSYALLMVQDATGGRTASLTGWDFGDNAASYNTTATRKNMVVGFYDGSEYLAVHSVKGAT